MGFKRLLFIFVIQFFCLPKVYGQVCVYQDMFKGGGTGDSFNPGSSNLNGQFDVFIEPGSTIKDAYLFVNVINNPEDQFVTFNGVDIPLSQESAMDNSYLVSTSSISWTIRTLLIDVKNIIDPNINTYTLTPPQNQPTTFIPGVFSEYYLYISYENPTLDFVSSAVFVNDIQPQQTQTYGLIDINPMNLIANVSLAAFTSSFCDTIDDGSFVSIDSSPIGLVGGDDDNSSLVCAGVSGSFYYQLGTVFGLGNDTPDPFMSGPDVVASIENYLLSTTSVSVEFQYQTPNSNQNAGPRTNPVHQLYLAYTSPCDTFSVTTPNDTTVCEGTQTQLNVTGGQTYEWSSPSAPSGVVPGLSCSTCPDPIFTADSSMFYTVRIWNNDSCSVVRPVKINVHRRPIFGAITTTPSECGAPAGSTDAGSITMSAEPNNTVVGSWFVDGVLTSSITTSGLVSGNHTVSFIDTNGCESLDSVVFVDEVNTTLADFTVNPTSGAAPLNVSIMNTSQNASNFEWFTTTGSATTSTGVTPPSFFNTSGDYVIQLVAWQFDPSCADTAFKTVFVYDSLLIQLPNVFTPNGDGTNDFFNVSTNLPLRYELVILNRWGNVVFELEQNISVGTTNIWNGKTQQNKVHEGVYFYQLRFDASEDTPEALKANLPLEKTGFVDVRR
jgi:gliding motility-associated-like protein